MLTSLTLPGGAGWTQVGRGPGAASEGIPGDSDLLCQLLGSCPDWPPPLGPHFPLLLNVGLRPATLSGLLQLQWFDLAGRLLVRVP